MVKIKAIIKCLIIAFFFSSFTILMAILIFGDTIDKGLSIINTFSLGLDYGTNENVSFDKVEKRLTVQPSWGTVFGRLKIPSISVDIPIYHGDDIDQLVDGAGHYAGSWFPGEGASIILAAHNSHGLFYTLPQIKKGDKIHIETIYGDFDYEVYYTDIRDYRDPEAFPIQDEKEMLILYTCYPVDNVWYVNDRFIAYAKLVGDKDE